MLHKEVITETGFDENAAEERQNNGVGWWWFFFFSFSLKVFFTEENPLWEMTRCGAPIVQGVRLSWTGLLFKMSVKWNYCMCLPATAVTAFQYTILNCSE